MAGYSDIYGDLYESESGADLVLDGNLFVSNPIFPVGSVSGPLLGNLFTSTSIFYAGAMFSEATLTGVLFQPTTTFFAGDLVYRLDGQLFQSVTTFPQGAIGGGELTLQGTLFQSATVFPTSTLFLATRFLTGNLFISPMAFHPGFIDTPVIAVARYPLHGNLRSANRKGTIRQ